MTLLSNSCPGPGVDYDRFIKGHNTIDELLAGEHPGDPDT